ncbi:MAG TPA: PTS sugar transporter subunit IIA [Erysipelotrichaceae bacterium]|nr:PTS sugar transporter subunit IIA [Erysipelotrichaceae bacterium]HQA85091.1 PTS sugar transporter subunit IIA [Erysipelotrichaceae bacterium]
MILNSNKYENIYLLKTAGGNDSTELLTELGQYAVDNALATDDYVSALLEREQQYPTGIQASLGIAIPHADQCYTIENTIIVALLDKPATFRSMGYGNKMEVEVVFMLLLNKDNQVKVLSELVRFIQDEKKLKELYTENGLNCMYETFGKYL